MSDSNFFSIEKLIEFGLGMSVAQQMINSMNQSINSMQIPSNQMPAQQQFTFYAMIAGKQAGPLTESELMQLIDSKTIDKDTYLWQPGMNDWKKVSELPQVLKLVALSPPPFKS